MKWPELYFSISDKTALYVSVSWKRYALFRFLPVFVSLSLFAGIFLKEYSQMPIIYATLASVIVYASFTDGLAIIRILTRSSDIKTYFNSWYQILLHLVTILLLVAVSVIAGLVSSTTFISTITPTPQGLSDNVWSSLIVVIIAFYLKEILSGEGPAEDTIFKKSQEGINPKVMRVIEEESIKEKANIILVKAICIAENLQRPKWIRNLENITHLLRKEGTYGIMQVKSKKPVSDVESVKLAINKYFKNTENINNADILRRYIRRYNDDERYIEVVFKIMYFLDYSSVDNNLG